MTKAPAKIGKYDVIERISLYAMGSMGAAHKAFDTALGASALITMMPGYRGPDRETQERFYSQAALVAQLQHPNILAVRDVGQQDGCPYVVMEYVDGETLDDIIKSGRPISVSEKIGYIIEVCRALSYVHQKRIVHRNIKPRKVMILKMGGVKIFVDFFSMACIDDEQALGRHAGTVLYLSPEQIRGEGVDTRSDIFSTGAVLYELLTGSLPFPFEGESTAADTLRRILNDPPRPFPDSLGSYAARLQEITFRALAKDRGLRYQTAEDLAFDLGELRKQIAA